jgi:hypothetical protein
MLDEEERRLADALAGVAEALPERDGSTAGQEVAALLRRLGHGSSRTDGRFRTDDPPQEQRPR